MVTVNFVVREKRLEEFVPLIRINAAMSLSEEPGCQTFDVCHQPDTPNVIFLYEVYDDVAAFERHKTMPHYLDFCAATEPMVNKKIVQTYRLIEGGDING